MGVESCETDRKLLGSFRWVFCATQRAGSVRNLSMPFKASDPGGDRWSAGSITLARTMGKA